MQREARLRELEKHEVYMGGQNVSGISKGYLLAGIRPESILPFGHFAGHTRRTDEITQLGVSPSAVDNNFQVKGSVYEQLEKVRKTGYISPGLHVHTAITEADRIASQAEAKIGKTDVGAVVSSVQLVAPEEALKYKSVQEKVAALKSASAISDIDFSEGVKKGSRVFLTAAQGGLVLGAALNAEQRDALGKVMGSYTRKIIEHGTSGPHGLTTRVITRNVVSAKLTEAGRELLPKNVLDAIGLNIEDTSRELTKHERKTISQHLNKNVIRDDASYALWHVTRLKENPKLAPEVFKRVREKIGNDLTSSDPDTFVKELLGHKYDSRLVQMTSNLNREGNKFELGHIKKILDSRRPGKKPFKVMVEQLGDVVSEEAKASQNIFVDELLSGKYDTKIDELRGQRKTIDQFLSVENTSVSRHKGNWINGFIEQAKGVLANQGISTPADETELYNKILTGDFNEALFGDGKPEFRIFKGAVLGYEKVGVDATGKEVFRSVSSPASGTIRSIGFQKNEGDDATKLIVEILDMQKAGVGASGATEITSHVSTNAIPQATGSLSVLGSGGRKIALNPIILTAEGINREQGQAMVDMVRPLMESEEFMADLLRRQGVNLDDNYFAGMKSRSLENLEQIKTHLAPFFGDLKIVNRKIALDNRVVDSFDLFTEAPDVATINKLKTHEGDIAYTNAYNAIQKFSAQRQAEQVNVLSYAIQNKLVGEGRTSEVDDIAGDAVKQFESYTTIHSIDDVLEGKHIEVMRADGGSIHFGTPRLEHTAIKTTADSRMMTNSGEAGVLNSFRSSQITLDIANSLLLKTRDVKDRLAIFKQVGTLIMQGSQLPGQAAHNLAILHYLNNPNASLRDSFESVVKGSSELNSIEQLSPGLKTADETADFLSGIRKGGASRSAWEELMSFTDTRINKLIRGETDSAIPGKLLDQMSNSSFILDVSAFNIKSRMLTADDREVPIKQLFVGPQVQAFGTDPEANFYIGERNRANLEILDAYASGDGEALQDAIEKSFYHMHQSEMGKGGIINAFNKGVGFGSGGYMKVSSSNDFWFRLENQGAQLFDANHDPIDRRMTSIISGKSLGSEGKINNVIGDIIGSRKAEDILEKAVYLEGDNGERVAVGSMIYGTDIRHPFNQAKNNAMYARQVFLHHGEDSNKEAFKQVINKYGLNEIYENSKVALVDSIMMGWADGDLDGDAVAKVIMDKAKTINPSDEILTILQGNFETGQKAIREALNTVLADDGAYNAVAEWVYATASKRSGKSLAGGTIDVANKLITGAIKGGSALTLSVEEAWQRTQGFTMQKTMTGRAFNFGTEFIAPAQDFMTKLFIDDVAPDLGQLATDLGKFSGLTNEDEIKYFSDLIIGRGGKAGILATDITAGAPSALGHTIRKLPISKGFSNMPFITSLMALSDIGSKRLKYVFSDATRSVIKTESYNMLETMTKAALSWHHADTTEAMRKQHAERISESITKILSQFTKDGKAGGGRELKAYLESGEYKSLTTPEKLADDVLKGLHKANLIVDAETIKLTKNMTGKEVDQFSSIMAKIFTGTVRSIQDLQTKAYGQTGMSPDVAINQFKEMGNYDNVVQLLNDIKQGVPISFNASTINNALGAREFENMIPKEGESKLRLDATARIESQNLGLADDAVKTADDMAKERFDKAIKSLEGDTRGYVSDIWDMVSGGAKWAYNRARWSVFDDADPTKTRLGDSILDGMKEGLDTIERGMFSATDSGRMGKIVVGGAIAAGLLGIAHTNSMMNSETIDFSNSSPLPRNVPLDQLEYTPPVQNTAPEQTVRVTAGGDNGARATMDVPYQGEDPGNLVSDLRSQTSIGVGTYIMNDHYSSDRVDYSNYRRERSNSRF
jgi:hypothetical protein